MKALMALDLWDGNCRESGKMKENYTKCPSSLLKLYVVILSFCKSTEAYGISISFKIVVIKCFCSLAGVHLRN